MQFVWTPSILPIQYKWVVGLILVDKTPKGGKGL
jgi:hypothetical protein